MKPLVLCLCALCVVSLAAAKSKEADWAGLIKQAAALVQLKGDLRTEPQRTTELLHNHYVGQSTQAVLQDFDSGLSRREYGLRTRELGLVLECTVYRVRPELELSVTFSFRHDAKGRVTDVAWQCNERALGAAK